jgi:hypothetical protein
MPRSALVMPLLCLVMPRYGSDFEDGSLKCTTGRQFTVAEKIEILDYYRGEGIYFFVVYYSYSSDSYFFLFLIFYFTFALSHGFGD